MNHDPRTHALLENASWVRALARQLLSDEGLAEDVAQEALTVALDRPPHSTSRSGLRGWLRRVTQNLAFQALRREASRRGAERAAARPDVSLDSAERVELQQRMASVVLGLDEIYRDVVVMRYFDGLAPAEIAARLGLPGPTVRKRLSRALERIGGALAGEFEADGRDWRPALALLAAARAPSGSPLASGTAVAAVGVLAAGLLGIAVLGPSSPVSASQVEVWTEFDLLLEEGRVFQLEGQGARELDEVASGTYVGARAGGGPLVVVPTGRRPELFDAPVEGAPTRLDLSPRPWVFGSVYIAERPPTRPLDMRLEVDCTPQELETFAPLIARGVLERAGDAIVLKRTTDERGFFGFGGLEPDAAVRVVLPGDLYVNFCNAGERLEGARGLQLLPGRDLVWIGAVPVERPPSGPGEQR